MSFVDPDGSGYIDLGSTLTTTRSSVYLDYDKFCVWYDSVERLPVATAHYLVEHDFKNCEKNLSYFKMDRRLTSEQQGHDNDFKEAGYGSLGKLDKGHLVPRNDMDKLVDEAATYVTTNVAPQDRQLNQQVWLNEVEEVVRTRTAAISDSPQDRAVVYTGTDVDTSVTERIPLDTERVRVPSAFWKVVLYLCPSTATVTDVDIFVFRQTAHGETWRDFDLESIEEIGKRADVRFQFAK